MEKEKHPKIRVSEETKKELDKIKEKSSYNSIIKNKILSGLDLIKIVKPLPVEIIEHNRPNWKGIVLADAGDVLYIAFRDGSTDKNPQQLVQINKSMIKAIRIIESPFTLLDDVDVKFCKNRFGDQWLNKSEEEK